MTDVERLKAAIDAHDFESVKRIMTDRPDLHQASLGYNGNGPLTWVAECRGTTPTRERLAIALDDRKRLRCPPRWRRSAHASSAIR